ncbi:MAG: lipopolysaccharide biosynthesis protein [Muribaculum sp.]|nr:lipopolysaccharide biosynthesis protein [Muribaculum sp.]
MAGVKSLAKDTAIYGVSSIVGRFLNWCLVPLYTRLFPEDMYGVVTYVYSIVALALIILTYGMETGFFRFANHERYSNPDEVYSTSLTSLGFTSTLFFALVLLFLEPVSRAMECGGHESYVWMMALAVAIDAYSCIPFAYLRYKKRPVRFAMLKLVNIGLNILLNIFFLLVCPWLMRVAPGWVEWFYVADFGIGYIFLSNLIASAVTLVMLLPDIVHIPLIFNGRLLREMLAYSFPLLVLGIAGIMNQTLDKILYPVLATSDAMAGLGIYGANYKIAIVMVMFIQAFRFAYEPFIFSQSRERGDNKLQAYRDAMKYFVIFAMFIFLGVMYYLDILRYFVRPDYWAGLKVVPVIMAAEFFFGVFFNLSLWYKLTDKTVWGTWFSLLGLAVTVVLNVLLVPRYGYMGCAWAAFCCYGVMMVASYFVGKVKYPIGYNVGRLMFYVGLAAVLYPLGCCIDLGSHWADFIYRGALLAVYGFVVMRREHLSLAMIIPRRVHR